MRSHPAYTALTASSLLDDGVRVISRLLRRAKTVLGAGTGVCGW